MKINRIFVIGCIFLLALVGCAKDDAAVDMTEDSGEIVIIREADLSGAADTAGLSELEMEALRMTKENSGFFDPETEDAIDAFISGPAFTVE